MELGSTPEFHMLNQYENEGNPGAHLHSTGPEIWHQTDGKITHFVAGLGTCGTITGNGRFLKSKNPDVKVIGVYPEDGHDIPGVRSLSQLGQTKFYLPDEYDDVVCVSDEEAYEMCLRLNREESLIAGPSSGMALAGALKVIEDDPEAVVVVIFPDNAFKYVSSFERHFPEFKVSRPDSDDGEPGPEKQFLSSLVENSRNAHNTLEADDLMGALAQSGEAPLVIDVRRSDAYAKQHISGAVNIPVAELKERQAELPEDRDVSIVTACFRGNMSISGMLVLQSMGYRNVKSLNGGTLGWADQDLPTGTQ
jgi:rhodanese-related sulfurtransferase